MIFLDTRQPSFPDPHRYHPIGGLMAQGGALSAEWLLAAYRQGIFPWYDPGEEILWWCPDPRFVMFPDEVEVSKSMRKILRDGTFSFTENTCFESVMRACAAAPRREQDGTWISEELISGFVALHAAGLAKSYEAWQGGRLVGGFYGLWIGRVFCGESMFSHASNASKAVFLDFVQKERHNLDLIDCQVHSDHLESLGARLIPKMEFLNILAQSTKAG